MIGLTFGLRGSSSYYHHPEVVLPALTWKHSPSLLSQVTAPPPHLPSLPPGLCGCYRPGGGGPLGEDLLLEGRGNCRMRSDFLTQDLWVLQKFLSKLWPLAEGAVLWHLALAAVPKGRGVQERRC